MAERTELPELAMGYMDQGLGHGHYGIIVVETNELLNVLDENKDRLESIVRACNRDNAFENLLTACDRVRSWLNEEHKEELAKTECEQILFSAIEKAEPKE